MRIAKNWMISPFPSIARQAGCLPAARTAAPAAHAAAASISAACGSQRRAAAAQPAATATAAATAGTARPLLRRQSPCGFFFPFATGCSPASFHVSRSSSSISSSIVSQFSSVDLERAAAGSEPHRILNLVAGRWQPAAETYEVLSPLTGRLIALAPRTQGASELSAFVSSLAACPPWGLHNPLHRVERYLLLGRVAQKAAALLHEQEIFDFFVKCIQLTMPKSYAQAAGEVKIVRSFLENFSGDNLTAAAAAALAAAAAAVMLADVVPADAVWMLPVCAAASDAAHPNAAALIITSRAAAAAVAAAAVAGNKPVVKAESRQGLPLEQFIRFLHFCGLPKEDVDMLSARGPVVSELLKKAPVKLVQFTGSTEVANELAVLLEGRVRIEDGGFNWKILCADADPRDLDFVAWQSDQDAYALSGQKCSAQSLLMIHRNWVALGFLEKIKELAARRSVEDLTVSPLLSLSNQDMQTHVDALLHLPGARLLFGGKPIKGGSPPAGVGLFEPTAIQVPLQLLLQDEKARKLATTEVFGPLQVVVEWGEGEEASVASLTQQLPHHLTAAVVTRAVDTLQFFLRSSGSGTTYAGIRARTTGAPQNHFFGPGGDPRGASIGTPQAVRDTWTFHREIVLDQGPIPDHWSLPPPS
ncbi:hypothetical protein Efla_007714 [Eimeria flavescens]